MAQRVTGRINDVVYSSGSLEDQVGDVAQQLGACTAPSEDPSLAPGTLGQLAVNCNKLLSGLHGHPYSM